MNLTGNLVSMYNVFTQVVTASQTCDYVTMATKFGALFKKLYTVAPNQRAGFGVPDLESSIPYQMANAMFLAL